MSTGAKRYRSRIPMCDAVVEHTNRRPELSV
jgi:hypothetical protein